MKRYQMLLVAFFSPPVSLLISAHLWSALQNHLLTFLPPEQASAAIMGGMVLQASGVLAVGLYLLSTMQELDK